MFGNASVDKQLKFLISWTLTEEGRENTEDNKKKLLYFGKEA